MKTFITGLIISISVVSAASGVDMGEIKCGETRSGSITEIGQEHAWIFQGRAGDGVVIATSRTSGWGDPEIRLHAPSGVREAEHPSFLEHQLKETGTYTIVIYEQHQTYTGEYAVSFVNLREACCPEIPCGGTVSDSFEVPADIGCYTFAGQAGDGVVIAASTTSGWGDPEIRLYAPSGVREAEHPSFLEHQLKETGTYTIVIYEQHQSYTGEYTVTLDCNISCDTIYVDDTASGANNGTNWTDAYLYLQDALAEAAACPVPVTIKVAQGVYAPDRTTANPDGTGERSATFRVINNVTVEGGYAGIAGADPDARDVIAYETILSGDLNYDDVVGIDPNRLATEPTRSDNSYHVVNAMGTDASAVLDGFTITGGNADNTALDSVADKGGGMLIYDGSPTLVNCTFSSNSAYSANPGGGRGGGVDIENGNPTLTNCTFNANATDGIYGGGLYIHTGSPTLTDCVFSENSAGRSGGGIHNGGNPLLNNCTFINNSAGEAGGGMSNESGDPNLVNCTFKGNAAGIYGGGFYTWNGEPILLNCILTRNSAANGGGVCSQESGLLCVQCEFNENAGFDYGGAAYVFVNSHATMEECMFIANNGGDGGGGVCHRETGIPMLLQNCLFGGNRAKVGAGILNDAAVTVLSNCTLNSNCAAADGGGVFNQGNAELTVVNCILWDNVDASGIELSAQIHNEASQGNMSVEYSCIQGWTGGVSQSGNLSADPLFALPGYWSDPNDPNLLLDPHDPVAVWMAGDNHLMSQVGRWDPIEDIWVSDELTSPCIDAGDPNSDWAEEPMPNGGRINMGAYGGTQGASKSPDTYTLAYRAGPNGSISGATTQIVNRGDDGTEVTPVPDAGYHFVDWSDGSTANPRTDINVTADVDVTANFAINTYTLTYNAGANGSIDGDTRQTDVQHGANGTEVTAVPDDGYHFSGWSDGSPDNPRTDRNVTADITVTANFEINTYTLTYNAGANGSINGDTPQEVKHGSDGTAVTADPNAGYHFVGWSDGSTDNPRTDPNVTADITVTANFERNPPVTVEDEVDSGDGQSETYFLPPGVPDDDIWRAEGGKYYRWYFSDWGWTHTFSPPAAAPESIISATLTIDAYDADPQEVHLIYGDGVLLGRLGIRDDRWRSTTFDLDPEALAELMDGTMDIWIDISNESTVGVGRVALRSSALTVTYNPTIDGN